MGLRGVSNSGTAKQSALLGHLGVIQLDRGFAAKDGNRNLELLRVVIDAFDHTVEVLERTVVDLDLIADLKGDQGAWGLNTLFDAAQDALNFGVTHRHRAALRTKEPGDPVDRGNQVIATVGHFHVDQNVAGHETTLGGNLLAATDLDHLFGGDQDLIDLVLQPLFSNRGANLLCDFLFEVRKNADRIPPFRHELDRP